MPYECEVEDLENYLSTLAPDQRAGAGGVANACPVYNALVFKYPSADFRIMLDGFFAYGSTDDGGWREQEYKTHSVLIGYIIREIDKKTVQQGYVPITREQVEKIIQQAKELIQI